MPDCPQTVRDLLPRPTHAAKATPIRNALRSVIRQTDDANEAPAMDDAEVIAVARALLEAGKVGRDEGQPTWSVLGRMLEEVVFTQTARKAWRLRSLLLVLPGEYLDGMLPLLADHPYRRYLQSLRYGAPTQNYKIIEVCTGLDIVDANHYMQQMFLASLSSELPEHTTGYAAWRNALSHTDAAAHDLEKGLVAYDERGWVSGQHAHWAGFAHRLRRVSPHAPLAIAFLIRKDWRFAKPHAQAWEKEFGRHPVVMEAFARHYTDARQKGRAERYLRWCMEHAPSKWCYETLAKDYRERGDKEKWAAILAEFAEKEDGSLEAAHVQARLANDLMAKGEWEKALPHALAAAECGTGSGMYAAGRCYEGLRRWTAAESHMRWLSERYWGSRFDWYYWCRRTGRGDVKRARTLALTRIANLKEVTEKEDFSKLNFSRTAFGVFYLIDQNPKAAKEMFQSAVDRWQSPYAALHLALLEGAERNDAARDAALKIAGDHLVDRGLIPPQPEYAHLGPMFARHLSGGASSRVDTESLDRTIDAMDAGDASGVAYLVGRFLQLQGDEKKAIRFLQRAAAPGIRPNWNRTLACVALRDLGIPVNEAASKPAAE